MKIAQSPRSQDLYLHSLCSSPPSPPCLLATTARHCAVSATWQGQERQGQRGHWVLWWRGWQRQPRARTRAVAKPRTWALARARTRAVAKSGVFSSDWIACSKPCRLLHRPLIQPHRRPHHIQRHLIQPHHLRSDPLDPGPGPTRRSSGHSCQEFLTGS